MTNIKDKIKILEEMGAEVKIISESPPTIEVEGIKLIKNMGVKIIVSPLKEAVIYPEKDWNGEVTERGFKEFIIKFDAEP